EVADVSASSAALTGIADAAAEPGPTARAARRRGDSVGPEFGADPFAEPAPEPELIEEMEPSPPAPATPALGDPFESGGLFAGSPLAPAAPRVSEPPPLPPPSPAPPADDVASSPVTQPFSDPPGVALEPAAPSLAGTGARTEDVDAILSMLRREQLFEAPDAAATAWPAPREARRGAGRTRIGRVLAVVWVVAVLVAVAGTLAYRRWVAAQEAEAQALVDQARADAFRGDHANLVDAERELRRARELTPLDEANPDVLLFVHAQRALEDGAFEPGYLRPTLERARARGLTGPLVDAGAAILAYAAGQAEAGREPLLRARDGGAEDPRVLYVVGRLEQRLGDHAALEHLAAAVEAAPEMTVAAVALAEAKADDGRPEEALALLEGVLEAHPNHLRATLWKTYLEADATEPAATREALAGLAERLTHGAPTDAVLAALTDARLLQREGKDADAEEAVERAAEAGATEPRLLGLVGRAALRLGLLPRAQQAARTAVRNAPAIPDLRKLLAEILITRRDGVSALQTLAPLGAEDPEVLALSGRAALLARSDEALEAARTALDARADAEELGVELQALRVRLRVATGQTSGALSAARRLAREHPGDPAVGLAYGEAALASGDAEQARTRLERVVTAAPEDPEAHFLLGRAHRRAGDADAAEAAFVATLERNPGFTDATLALGYLLLDTGQWERARELFEPLSRRLPGTGRDLGLVGKLGLVEALLGIGNVPDAKVQLERVRPAQRELESVQRVSARVALADGRPGDAVRTLRARAMERDAAVALRVLYADALFAAGETLAASSVYEAALGDDAGHPEALLGFATVLLRGDKADEAEAILARAAGALAGRLRPPALRARLAYLEGRAALSAEDLEAAREKLRAATTLPDAPPEAFFYLGESLAGVNAPEARTAYEQFLERVQDGGLADRARAALR
ncbi:MAG: tetratricopeptide repeat protein, partial [Myxococcota bacterium]